MIYRRIKLLLLGLLAIANVYGQERESYYAETIKIQDIKQIIEYLAADGRQGRDIRGEELSKVAEYLVDKFKGFGIKHLEATDNKIDKGYFQSFPLIESEIVNGRASFGEKSSLRHGVDFIFLNSPGASEKTKGNLVYVGDGNESTLKDLDINGAIVLVKPEDGIFSIKRDLLIQKGAKGIVIIYDKGEKNFRSFLNGFGVYLAGKRIGLEASSERKTIPTAIISRNQGYQLLGISPKKLKKEKFQAKFSISKTNEKLKNTIVNFELEKKEKEIWVKNVLGFIKGSEFPDEVIVVTAHYDHVGVKGEDIFNGADDNGSGTTALLEVAEAFALATKDGFGPKRSILFMPLTAEEEGLLGSLYYSENPIFPLENTILNLNMDMVGHLDQDHDHPNFVSVVGSDWLSADLHQIHEKANKEFVNLELDYTYNSKDHPERFYYRSDQYNFAKHGIPVIFYTSGDHEDYHKPTDTVENISFFRIRQVARLVFHTLWTVANRKERLKLDAE